MSIATVSEQDFEAEVMASEMPVLAQFTAEWCQPCKQMAPEIEALATQLDGKAKVVKIDIDASPRLAEMLRVQSVPTFVVFAAGRPVAAEQGVVPRARLEELIEPFLPRAQGALKATELAELLKQQQVVAIDTRDARTYSRAHIPGAVNMPLDEIETRLAELLMHGQPVLYCRLGDESKALSEKLVASGAELPFLDGGFLAWEVETFPIERG
jgi:thioredoxin 1/putative thioredoxin